MVWGEGRKMCLAGVRVGLRSKVPTGGEPVKLSVKVRGRHGLKEAQR